MRNCTKPNFMAIHRSTSRAETAMTQKEEEEPSQEIDSRFFHLFAV